MIGDTHPRLLLPLPAEPRPQGQLPQDAVKQHKRYTKQQSTYNDTNQTYMNKYTRNNTPSKKSNT